MRKASMSSWKLASSKASEPIKLAFVFNWNRSPMNLQDGIIRWRFQVDERHILLHKYFASLRILLVVALITLVYKLLLVHQNVRLEILLFRRQLIKLSTTLFMGFETIRVVYLNKSFIFCFWSRVKRRYNLDCILFARRHSLVRCSRFLVRKVHLKLGRKFRLS